MQKELFRMFPIFALTDETEGNNFVVRIRFVGFQDTSVTKKQIHSLLDKRLEEGYPLCRSNEEKIIAIEMNDGSFIWFADIEKGYHDLSYVAFVIDDEVEEVIANAFACAQRHNMVDMFFTLANEIAQVGVNTTYQEKFKPEESYTITTELFDELVALDEDTQIFNYFLRQEVLTTPELIDEFNHFFVKMGIDIISYIKN